MLAGCVTPDNQPSSHPRQDTLASPKKNGLHLIPPAGRRVAVRKGIVTSSAQPSSAPRDATPHAPDELGKCDAAGQCALLLKGAISPPSPSDPQVSNETNKDAENRAGIMEPDANVRSTTDASIFVNGVLIVPAAPTDVDIAPVEVSTRNAADDTLPIAGYVLKHLTDRQRRTIIQSVLSKQPTKAAMASADSYALVGALVPTSVALDGLSPLPEKVVASLPELTTVMFTISGEKLLLINPRIRLVIGVLDP